MSTAILTGLVLGSIYVLVAVGYNIVFLASGAFNFAQAAVVMLGAFIASAFGVERGLPTIAVLLVATLIGGIVGIITEVVAIRPVVGKGLHGELVTTVGVSTILTGVVVVLWGVDIRPVNPLVSADVVSVLGGRVTIDGLILIGAAILTCVALWAWSRLTISGLASLAVSEDRDAATLRGINVNYLSIAATAAAGAIGGVAGVLVGTQTLAVASIAAVLTLNSFLVLIIGGMGSFPGLLIGGLVVGILEAMTGRYLGSEYVTLALFALLLGVLLVKPEGLFGQKVSRVV